MNGKSAKRSLSAHKDHRRFENSKRKHKIDNNEISQMKQQHGVRIKVPRPWKMRRGEQIDQEWRRGIQLSKPSEIGAFKKNKNKQITVTREAPPVLDVSSIIGADLNEGFDPSDSTEDTGGTCSTDEIMACLDAKRFDLQQNRVNFVTYRNNLNKILGAPYQNNPWKIQVHRRHSVIFLEVVKDPASEPESEWQRRCCYWGRRFEEYCLGVDQNAGEDGRSEHCIVVRTRLNSHRLVVGAEIDGCFQQSDGVEYIELKTSKEIKSERDQWSFDRYKSLKFWIQSYLVGVPYVYVGFRDDQGIVSSAEKLKTTKLDKVQNRHGLWDSNVCLNFADSVLNFLSCHTQENVSYVMEFNDPYDTITLMEL